MLSTTLSMKGRFMKHMDLKLMCELLQNCRRSDRELAKKIGVSQTTVTRIRRDLERDGLIREYTVVPDFEKLGYELLTFSFLKYSMPLSDVEYEKLKMKGQDLAETSSSSTIIMANGIGQGSDRIIVAFHKDYSTFAAFKERMKNLGGPHVKYVDSFIVSLKNLKSARMLALSAVADRLPKM